MSKIDSKSHLTDKCVIQLWYLTTIAISHVTLDTRTLLDRIKQFCIRFVQPELVSLFTTISQEHALVVCFFVCCLFSGALDFFFSTVQQWQTVYWLPLSLMRAAFCSKKRPDLAGFSKWASQLLYLQGHHVRLPALCACRPLALCVDLCFIVLLSYLIEKKKKSLNASCFAGVSLGLRGSPSMEWHLSLIFCSDKRVPPLAIICSFERRWLILQRAA